MIEMLLVKDYSVSQIAKELSVMNFPAPLGGKWYQATVSRILRNETYKGTYYHGKTRVVKYPDGTKQVPQPREEWRQINVPSFITEGIYKQILSKLEDLNTKNRKTLRRLLAKRDCSMW